MNIEGSGYQEHYANLRQRLTSLRPLFLVNESLSSFRTYFDEELDANEFEVALHALCDFLLEPTTPGIRSSEIEEIEMIHQKMDLEDGCAASLRAKMEPPTSPT